jgi:hypothetical protein
MTVTANLHIGLAAWQASHVYTIMGTRINHSGVAYQLITTGTSSTSGPTGTGSSITDGTCIWKWLSAIDYSTIPSWAAAIPGTPTQPYIGLLWNDGPITTTVGTQFFDLTGHATTSTNTITLTCAAGESIRDTLAGQTTPLAFNATNGVNFQYPSGVGTTDYITVEDSYVTIKGIQFQDTYAAGSASSIMQINTPSSNMTVTDCLFDGYGQPNGGNLLAGNSSTNFTISNCVFIDRETAAEFGDTFANYGCTNTHFVNCTFIATVGSINGNAIQMPTSTMTGTVCTNCIFIGYLAAFNNTSGYSVTLNNCMTEVSSFGTGITLGSGNQTSVTKANQFVNVASDWRLKAGSNAVNAGTTDTTDLPTADDIAKTTRPQGTVWDIGAWELKVSGGPMVSILD